MAKAKAFTEEATMSELSPRAKMVLSLGSTIVQRPGINRTGLREVVGHKVRAEAITQSLAWLESRGMAHHEMVQPQGSGRKAECWHPGRAKV